MPYLAGELGFGQLVVRAAALQAIQQSPSWSSWPTAWQRGVGASLTPPAAGAFTAPARLGAVINNLATMVKRLDQIQHAAKIETLRAIGITVSKDYRIGPDGRMTNEVVTYRFAP